MPTTSSTIQQGLYIDGKWIYTSDTTPVLNKYTGQEIGTISNASLADLDHAINTAQTHAKTIASMPANRRADILLRTAEIIKKEHETIAQTIAAESGKAMKFAKIEALRAVDTFTIAAEEAKRIHGETIPLDAVSCGEGYFGFWQRKPVGAVAAITPFNFPLNLVAHKVAPAIAAGNSVVLKPATTTPLTSGLLCQIMEKAGLPNGVLNLVHGSGSKIGTPLVSDPRIAKVTFTGSPEVGKHIIEHAGIKKVTLELGNNAPVIVCEDADLDLAAQKCVLGAFYNSGQICISVQRIYVSEHLHDTFCDKLLALTEKLIIGDPLDENTDVGPMIQQCEAERIESWVDEATAAGARVLIGGKRNNATYLPTLLTNVTPDMKVMANEAFAPVACITPFSDFNDVLAQADDSDYGLQAAIFTKDIDRALLATQKLNFGGVIINEGPNFRADHMPYGGTRNSGLGREGLRFAIEEMTNIQAVIIRSPSMDPS
ncbi:aldehyde dehydrogenase family protein [Poriferisphaera sp. WC338]|uniref:aldehyde dehydrogenase family protein n=1 Tax=Poriferisphaera sp. WC338 TaxID=3425129 RepID=UPI003D817B60